MTNPAKTVADCFRYRRHVGLDTALTALRDYLARGRGPERARAKDFTIDALFTAARVARITSVLRP